MSPSRDDLAERYLDQLPYTAVPGPGRRPARLVHRRAGRPRLRPDRHRQDAHRPGRPVRGAAHRHRRLLHHAAHRPDRAEVPARCRSRAVRWGFQRRRRRPGHRQPPRQSRRPRPRRRGRDPAQPPAPSRRRSISATSRPSSWTSSTTSPTRERGIVWELSLAMLPKHIRLLLLSATVGNALEFLNWLERCHGRKLELVEGKERKVPLTFRWVPDEFLGDQLVDMAKGDGDSRTTPALVFCFNRDECWSVAEMLKGLTCCRRAQKAAAQRRGRQARLDAGRRPEAEADAAPRRRRPSCRPAAEVSPRRRGPVHAQAAGRRASAPRRWRPASTCRPGRWC